MIKSEYYVIGCMSGTSLDGLDLTYIKFNINSGWKFEIITADTIAYSNDWQLKLKDLVTLSESELNILDNKYTMLLAHNINNFIKQKNIKIIDAICCHGHTALHQPSKGLTYQIGNLSNIAILTRQTVICDFRKQDVELGGQGAPLVPIGDKLLFSEYQFCLNLGGFANISFEKDNQRIAFDICPANIVLNHYASKLGFEYDSNGKIASEGKVNKDLLNELNNLEFYKADYPKSLGFEWVKMEIYPLIDSFNLNVPDILRTFVEHIAIQIITVLDKKSKSSVLITGGGAYNMFLINLIKKKSPNTIVIPNKDIVEFKEALIFGLLGVLKLRNEINCLASVTGANRNHSSGVIYLI